MTIGGLKMDLELHPIVKDQVATFEVQGGFARKPSPCDGLLIETRTSTILLPIEELNRALKDLKRLRSRNGSRDIP